MPKIGVAAEDSGNTDMVKAISGFA